MPQMKPDSGRHPGLHDEAAPSTLNATVSVQLYDELRRSEAFLSEAQRLSHTGTFGWKTSSGEICWTDECRRIFEYDRASAPTLELMALRVHPDDLPAFRQIVERATNDGQDFTHGYRLRMPDERVKHIHVVARAFRSRLALCSSTLRHA
jgi:hypothetical protein